ncbi:phage tail tape measure protein [Chelatococcus sp. XZ-Ab1]|uniref:phage tail tape measure protein n=1 Tax=Chelatococcus sp. XZ-Ab1 TaxID=3034027 RepID=UPI0023E3A73F|nr:phage tail tape measure protein [Chelatococcus sp. XZ-Ab1]
MTLVGGFGAKSVYEFEKMSNAVKAVTNITDEQKRSLQSYAQELNKLFPFTNRDIMSAAFELGRAGFKFDQVMGSLRGTLNLALAGDIELQRSADIATNILTAMRLPAQTAEEAASSLQRVNDVIAHVAASSNTDVGLMGDTLKYVAPIAAVAGVSLEELGAASMVLAKGGIRGAEAGVAMRSALTRMVKPSLDARQAMAELGLSFEDFATSFRAFSIGELAAGMKNVGFDISPVMGQLRQRLEGKTLEENRGEIYEIILETLIGGLKIDKQVDQRKVAKSVSRFISSQANELDMIGLFEALVEKGVTPGQMARIFDQRQGARLTNLLRDLFGTPELTAALEEIEKNASGSTDRMAKTRMEGIVGVVAAHVAAWENLFIAIARSGVLEAVTNVLTTLTGALEKMAQSNPELLKWGTYALMAVAALGPLTLLLGGFAAMLGLIAGSMKIIAASAAGTVAVFRAAAGLGAATGGAAGAAGAAGTVAGAAGKRGVLGRALKWGGILGTAWGLNELLGAIDPEGNLWGATSGIDAWFLRNLGFNPSKLGGGVSTMPGESQGEARAELHSRLEEIDRKIGAIEARTHPAMRDAPNPELDRLRMERAGLANEAASMGAAGQQSGAAFRQGLNAEMQAALKEAEATAARIKSALEFTAQPTIRPRVDGATLRGVHADTGVD